MKNSGHEKTYAKLPLLKTGRSPTTSRGSKVLGKSVTGEEMGRKPKHQVAKAGTIITGPQHEDQFLGKLWSNRKNKKEEVKRKKQAAGSAQTSL